jgi:hypothetical protein
MTKHERVRLRKAIRLLMGDPGWFTDAMDILADLAREPAIGPKPKREVRPSPALAEALRHLLGEPDHA